MTHLNSLREFMVYSMNLNPMENRALKKKKKNYYWLLIVKQLFNVNVHCMTTWIVIFFTQYIKRDVMTIIIIITFIHKHEIFDCCHIKVMHIVKFMRIQQKKFCVINKINFFLYLQLPPCKWRYWLLLHNKTSLKDLILTWPAIV